MLPKIIVMWLKRSIEKQISINHTPHVWTLSNPNPNLILLYNHTMTVLGAYRLSDDSIVMFADRRSVSDGMSIISEDEDKIYRYVYNEITYTILLT